MCLSHLNEFHCEIEDNKEWNLSMNAPQFHKTLAVVFLAISIDASAFFGFKKTETPLEISPTFTEAFEKKLNGLSKDPQKETIEKFVQSLLALEKPTGAGRDFLKVCEDKKEFESLCVIFQETKSSPGTSRARKKNQKIQLAKKNLSELNGLDLQTATSVVGRAPLKTVLNFSQELNEDSTCQSAELYTALGAQLETGLPQEEYFKAAIQMFGKAVNCHNTESAHRSAFRLGMLHLLKNQCAESIQAFQKIPKNENMGFIHSRAQYWTAFCQKPESQKLDASAIKNQVYERFSAYPMSFHSVLFSLERNDQVFNKIKSQIEPKVLFRTEKDSALNMRVGLVEALLEKEKIEYARILLSRIVAGDLQKLEPHFRLYMGLLYHQTFLSLQKFQVLSQLFNEDVTFKSVSTLKIMYPLWKYEIVDHHTKVTDPLLVLALIRQESAFQETARSLVGARGLMQIMPRTGRSLAQKKNFKPNDLYDPELNVRLGTLYIDKLIKRYDGNLFHVLAAYNAGALRVDEWKKRYPTENTLIFMDLIPFRETREYVASILRNYYWYSQLYPEQSKRQFVFWDKSLSSQSEN